MSANTTTTNNNNAKTVLVTGATRGIGLKFAELYAKNGWNVIAAARDLDRAEQLKALAPYKIVQLDASDEASIVRAAKELEGESIDLLINNAGILIPGDLETLTKADLVKQFEVNSVGPLLVTRAFVPHLKAAVAVRGAAFVAQISSGLGSADFLTNAVWPGKEMGENFNRLIGYSTSKMALSMINVNLARDLKPHGIAAYLVHPGLVSTEMNGNASAGATADERVEVLVRTLAKRTLDDAGKFFDFDGEITPW